MGPSAQGTTHGSVKIPCSTHALKPDDFAFQPPWPGAAAADFLEDDLLITTVALLLRIVYNTTCPTKRGLLNYTKIHANNKGK